MKGFISEGRHPFFVLLLLLGFMLLGYFVASILFIAVSPLLGIEVLDITNLLANPTENPKGADALLVFQGFVQFTSFVVAPLLMLRFMNVNIDSYLNWKKIPLPALLLLAGLLIIFIMPANSLIINWNAKLNLPDFMAGFEAWARAKEDELAELTKLIANFGTLPRLLAGLLVIAVIPAIGEELVFRGVMQRQVHRWSGNAHVAVWVAAIIFSTIHVQFFGFVPRMLLGALFGYLYLWSGNIWVPIVAHFFNNGFTVFLLYLQQTGAIDFNVESTEPMPFYTILLSAVLSAAVIYYLYKQFMQTPTRPESIAEAAEERQNQ
ncbi:CPBP family intramembrane metalloprotease [Pontibacter sp. JH31]|uniref:CPBP family intramembrane metalloprotease n=1 Tax=Pontibacter aquaedesilientis TaxID=2766980 RepID=A0ABR7XL12_9BACT|nr:CPBP family intramembrane glutamic endopeptidase [Pontibacter aquaedesilientis]MBD1398989.1 CPBP family intramembrane metalloprotease [Pontibacter aquaedesilientis]